MARQDGRLRAGLRWAGAALVWALTQALIAPIRFYQRFLSPLKGPTCRFYPTCSEYARQAIIRHGPVRGLGLAVWRVLRCHPFSRGGHDPVPD